MEFGKTRISDVQFKLLHDARTLDTPGSIASSLVLVANDQDITSKREQIHNDWIEIFQKHRSNLQKIMPEAEYQRVAQVFATPSPYDKLVHSLNVTKKRVTFLLGAGCSKPHPTSIPTVKELLPDLLERARRLDREDLTKLADFCTTERIDNIEDLLTAAQLGTYCSRNSNTLKLLDFLLKGPGADEERGMKRRRVGAYSNLTSVPFLQDTLQGLFGLLISRMLPAKPNKAHEAIADYVMRHRGSRIVTTNYDCCIDLAFAYAGKNPSYEIEFSNINAPTNKISGALSLIKLHGSLNWFYCDSCQDVQLIEIGLTVKYFIKDKAPYPVVASCPVCGGQRRPLLVPPLAMKFDVPPPLNPLLRLAANAFESSELIVVVGYSFAEADLYISRMLSKSMQKRSEQKLLLVDTDDSVVARVRRKFEVSIHKFDPSRIVKMCGDCAKELPQFLTGRLYKPREKGVSGRDGRNGDSSGSITLGRPADKVRVERGRIAKNVHHSS